MTRASRSAPTRRESARNYQTREFVSDTLDAINRSRVYQYAPTLPDEYERTTVVMVNNTGSDAARYRPLAIQGCLPATAAESVDWYIDNVLLTARPPISGDRNNFVLPIVPISAGESGLCAVAGLVACPVYFAHANATWIKRCDMEAGIGTLVALPEGAAEIVYADPTALAGPLPGEVDCIVRLAPPVNVSYAGKAVNPIIAGGSGPVSLFQGGTDTTYQIPTAHLDHMEQGLDISADKEVIVEWFHMEKRWRITHAECEDNPPAIGQLDDLGEGGTQALTTTPAVINAFDAGASGTLSTPNVILQGTNNSSIQIPDVPAGGHVYTSNISGTLSPGANNVSYDIWLYVNGVQQTPPIVTLDGRQAGTSLTYANSSIIPISQQSSPTLDLRISMGAGTDTITWSSAKFSLERNLDF